MSDSSLANSSQVNLQSAQLQQLYDRSAKLVSRCAELRTNLSDSQLQWKPDAKSWSICEGLAHLVTTGAAYYPRIGAHEEFLIRENKKGNGEIKLSLLGKMMNSFMTKPMKLKAPGKFLPEKSESTPQCLEAYTRQLEDEFLPLIVAADGLELSRYRFKAPIFGFFLRFTTGDGLTLMTIHQERHFDQIERLKSHGEFPTADAD